MKKKSFHTNSSCDNQLSMSILDYNLVSKFHLLSIGHTSIHKMWFFLNSTLEPSLRLVKFNLQLVSIQVIFIKNIQAMQITMNHQQQQMHRFRSSMSFYIMKFNIVYKHSFRSNKKKI